MNSIEGGSKIESIKLLRDATGLGLKESKDLIEKIESIIKSSPHKNEAIKNAKAQLEKEMNKVTS